MQRPSTGDLRKDPRSEPDEVSAILRLNELGWSSKRIARELGISRNTVKGYVVAGGWTPYRQPQRNKELDGQETWLKERLRQHHGNADMIRQELAAEKGIIPESIIDCRCSISNAPTVNVPLALMPQPISRLLVGVPP